MLMKFRYQEDFFITDTSNNKTLPQKPQPTNTRWMDGWMEVSQSRTEYMCKREEVVTMRLQRGVVKNEERGSSWNQVGAHQRDITLSMCWFGHVQRRDDELEKDAEA